MQTIEVKITAGQSRTIQALDTAVKIRGLIEQFDKLVAESGLTEADLKGFVEVVNRTESTGHECCPETWAEYVRKGWFEDARYRARIIRAVILTRKPT